MLAFLNHFIIHTASFLNQFSVICEEKLEDLSVRLQRLETTLCLLEAKVRIASVIVVVVVVVQDLISWHSNIAAFYNSCSCNGSSCHVDWLWCMWILFGHESPSVLMCSVWIATNAHFSFICFHIRWKQGIHRHQTPPRYRHTARGSRTTVYLCSGLEVIDLHHCDF